MQSYSVTRFNILFYTPELNFLVENISEVKLSDEDVSDFRETFISNVLNNRSLSKGRVIDRSEICLFMTEKLIPLETLLSGNNSQQIDEAAVNAVSDIFVKRENSVSDVPFFSLDEELPERLREEISKGPASNHKGQIFVAPLFLIMPEEMELEVVNRILSVANDRVESNELRAAVLSVTQILGAIAQNRLTQSGQKISIELCFTERIPEVASQILAAVGTKSDKNPFVN